MQPTPPQIDPESPRTQPETPQNAAASNDGETSAPETVTQANEPAESGALVSVVPHEAKSGVVSAPVRIRTNRYGDLEEHELIRLLDTIEDERARGRFRESMYISMFVWIAIAWVLFYGPKYLWHSPQLITPTEALQQQALVQLNAPRLPHRTVTAAPPKIDKGTLAKLRAMEPKPLPATTPVAPEQPPPPPVMQPTQPVPAPALPLPTAPRPRAAEPEPNAPLPQAPSRPIFNTPSTASQNMQQAMRGSQDASAGQSLGIQGGGGGTKLGQGVDILSDTQGVDFQPYLQRILREIYQQWIPLIPEEARPPLRKQGTTQIRFTINADGTIAAMHLDGSSHDDALNRAAWGSITGVGQFPPLPKQFHGPNLELRIHYLVNQDSE